MSQINSVEATILAIAPKLGELKNEISKRIFGQQQLLDELLPALLCRSHAILTGVPGLAKTLLIKTLAESAELQFTRIQFTPDMMPADILGSEILEEQNDGRKRFVFSKGPIFTQLLLADEINRTPPKTQSALLEAMEEQQISVAGQVFPLPNPFFVLATQNPIEQEGTYQLPEAQQDRFMFSLKIDYPDFDSEVRILKETTTGTTTAPQKVISAAELIAFQQAVRQIPIPDSVAQFAVRLVRASRPEAQSGKEFEFIRRYVRWGAGPRACQYLALAGKAFAALEGRFNVSTEDIRRAAYPVLRHRLLLNFHAQADNVTSEQIIQGLLKTVR